MAYLYSRLALAVGPFTSLGTNDDAKDLLEALEVMYPAGTTSEAEVVQAYRITGMLDDGVKGVNREGPSAADFVA